MHLPGCFGIAATIASGVCIAAAARPESNYLVSNPALPGWHSDPSCIFVPELDDTFFCVVSTFLVFPGHQVYSSKDLVHWRLASNAFNRPSQFPDFADDFKQSDGFYAGTLRYHNGIFYLATCEFRNSHAGFNMTCPVFMTKDIYSDAAWSDSIAFIHSGYDPDLFFDDDGQVYVTTAQNFQIFSTPLDLNTGESGTSFFLWNGTGGVYPEGPHLHKKDGYYYLTIAEGGTDEGHMQTVARSRDIRGPYESFAGNPILTNANTTQYMQGVGHADFFQDKTGNWWGAALAHRSGPEYVTYPMGRETVLFPMQWEKGDWPKPSQVRGEQRVPDLLPQTRNIRGQGPLLDEGDSFDFESGSSIPPHFLYQRFPEPEAYTVAPPGHPQTLALLSSVANLTATENFTTGGQTFISRRQTDTLFSFSVDLSFGGRQEGSEAGVSLFANQYQHADLGIVLLRKDERLVPYLRFRVEASAAVSNATVPKPTLLRLPCAWRGQGLRLQIKAVSVTRYVFSAAAVRELHDVRELGSVEASLLSGGGAQFIGMYNMSQKRTSTNPDF